MHGSVRVTTTTGVSLAYELDSRGTPFDGTAMIGGPGNPMGDMGSRPGDDLSLRNHLNDNLTEALDSFGMAKLADEEGGNIAQGLPASSDSMGEYLDREGHVHTRHVGTDASSPRMPSIRHPYAVMLPPAAVMPSNQVVRGKYDRYSIDWTETHAQ